MKIAILTFTASDNYGQRLQNYALQELLSKQGHEVNTILQSEDSITFKRLLKLFINLIIGRDKNWNKLVRKIKFFLFDRKYIHYSEMQNTFSPSNSIADHYDRFVSGSDQVWAPVSARLGMYMQSTIPSTKKYSYAASIAAYDIPENLKGKYREYLSDFELISVRENKSKELLEDILVGKNIRVDLDPTLLLRKQDWEKIEKKPKWISNQKKYILVYNLDSSIPIELQVFAEKNGFDILSLMDESSKAYKSDPSEFIYLIHNAELVYTDSYHGTIFAILFEKQFIHATRQQNTVGHSMNSRFDTLFDKLGINSQKVSTIGLKNVDYADINQKLDAERKQSQNTIKMIGKATIYGKKI